MRPDVIGRTAGTDVSETNTPFSLTLRTREPAGVAPPLLACTSAYPTVRPLFAALVPDTTAPPSRMEKEVEVSKPVMEARHWPETSTHSADMKATVKNK